MTDYYSKNRQSSGNIDSSSANCTLPMGMTGRLLDGDAIIGPCASLAVGPFLCLSLVVDRAEDLHREMTSAGGGPNFLDLEITDAHDNWCRVILLAWQKNESVLARKYCFLDVFLSKMYRSTSNKHYFNRKYDLFFAVFRQSTPKIKHLMGSFNKKMITESRRIVFCLMILLASVFRQLTPQIKHLVYSSHLKGSALPADPKNIKI